MISIGSRIVYELDHKNPILYVIPVESVLGKLPVVPEGDTGTIPHRLRGPAQPLLRGAWRPQAGFRRWMQDVVCQLVGIGMVVMKRGRKFERLLCDMGSM
jgi:hypothetical protein